MPSFDSRFWNLSQAAAWVVYRKRELVEQFSTESADGWRALILYPDMRKYEPVSALNKLLNKLILGRLTAWGRRNEIRADLEAIPAREWNDLWISPPSVKRSHPMAGQIEPWTGLRFESSDLKKIWRGLLETQGRTRYKWDVARTMWHEISKRLPDASENERISELQSEYELRYGSSPSRSSIQAHVKDW